MNTKTLPLHAENVICKKTTRLLKNISNQSMNTFSSLTKDDTILIQANCVHLIRKYGISVCDILEDILSRVGTAVFPTFSNNGFPNKTFDIRNTKSDMGVLSEFARNYPSSIRSGHPMFSFVAIGNRSHLFNVNNYSGYGKDSPFSILRRLNGKVGVLGLVNSHGNTLFHHVEEIHQVPYRFYKNFTGRYTDRKGVTEYRTYAFYCNGGVKTLLNPIDEIFWNEGLYTGDKPYEGDGFRTIDANKMYNRVSRIITDGKAEGLLYERI
jgi:aminoglycoside 3-N-acetyltransferase